MRGKMKNFEKFIAESFNSHLKEARLINEKKKRKKKTYSKFLFLDFDDTLFDNETQSMMEGEAYQALVDSMSDPEPCYICIVTARRSDTKEFVKEKVTRSIEDLLEEFKGKLEIETVLDDAVESKPSVYEVAKLKADCINTIINDNVENLQENILVYFFDDVEENVKEVSNTLDYLNIPTDNCYIV